MSAYFVQSDGTRRDVEPTSDQSAKFMAASLGIDVDTFRRELLDDPDDEAADD